MPTANRLGITVVGVTLVICSALYGIYWGIKKVFFASQSQPTAQGTAATNPPATGQDDFSVDSDQDELPDLVENVYQTNPTNPDTDGDSTSDGREIALGRDPLKAAPDDTLQDVPTGTEIKNADTYTAKYLATLPADLPREEVLNKERIAAFIEQEKGSILPELVAGSIQTSPASGKKAVEEYLNAISSAHNPDIKAVSSTDIDTAYRAYYASPATSTALKDVRTLLEQNVAALQKIAAPAETTEVHTKLVAASQALADNVRLLEHMPDDFVGGLIGAKKIEELGSVFQSIADAIIALENKYKL